MSPWSLFSNPSANLPETLLLGFLIGAVALYSLLTNVYIVFPFQDLLTQIYLPRVYVSESKWLHRFTDKFRFTIRGHEAVQKGYRLVPPSNAFLIRSSQKACSEWKYLATAQ